jgi:hypothetical protein
MSLFLQFIEMVCLFLDKIAAVLCMYAFTTKQYIIPILEPIVLETVFWYNRKLVETQHYMNDICKTNDGFRLVKDLVETTVYFVYQTGSYIWQSLVYTDTEPMEPWISSVQIHNVDGLLQMTQQYTVFGFKVDDRTPIQKFYNTLEPVLNCIEKILEYASSVFMGRYYDSSAPFLFNEQSRSKIMGTDFVDGDEQTEYCIPESSPKIVDNILKRAYMISHEHFSELFNNQLQTMCIQFQELLEIMKAQGFQLVTRKVNSVNTKGQMVEYTNTFYTNNGTIQLSPIHQSMLIAKKYERYTIRHAYWNVDFVATKLDFTPSEVEFLAIEYHHPEMENPMAIQLPASMMVVGSEILSFAFMYRYFKQLPRYTKYVFDHRYVLRILDDCVNMVEIYSNQCIKLSASSYKIVECDMM